MKITDTQAQLIQDLTDSLPSLRASLVVSQSEISKIIGVSRQTYSAIETRKRRMSWTTFLSLVLFFWYNEETAKILTCSGNLSAELCNFLNIKKRRN